MTEHRASCQCGALKIVTANDPDFVVACNCVACQRRTGAAFGVGGYFKRDDIEVHGSFKSWSRSSDSGRALTNHFCETCGSNVYWDLEMRPGHVGIALGAFETKLPDPARAIWTQAKHDWVQFPDHWDEYSQGTPEK